MTVEETSKPAGHRDSRTTDRWYNKGKKEVQVPSKYRNPLDPEFGKAELGKRKPQYDLEELIGEVKLLKTDMEEVKNILRDHGKILIDM